MALYGRDTGMQRLPTIDGRRFFASSTAKTFPPVRLLAAHERQRILVTGGAGFVGSHLVDRLMCLGHDVIVLDNYFSGACVLLSIVRATQADLLVQEDGRLTLDVRALLYPRAGLMLGSAVIPTLSCSDTM
jgi:hypothetical protein